MFQHYHWATYGNLLDEARMLLMCPRHCDGCLLIASSLLIAPMSLAGEIQLCTRQILNEYLLSKWKILGLEPCRLSSDLNSMSCVSGIAPSTGNPNGQDLSPAFQKLTVGVGRAGGEARGKPREGMLVPLLVKGTWVRETSRKLTCTCLSCTQKRNSYSQPSS